MTRAACVDIGSNTTRLLVAERDGAVLREVGARRAFLPLGCEPGESISPEDVETLARTVARHVLVARELGAERIRIVATAAVRAARNAEELCAAVTRRAGIAVDVLGGDAEAELAFAGATAGLQGDDPVGVIDVGGGSSEIVTGSPSAGVAWSRSLPVGSGTLTRRHAEAAAIEADVAALLAGVEPPPVTRALAVGGSAMALLLVAGADLSRRDLDDALTTLAELPTEVAAAHFGVDPRRARLMPAGLILLRACWSALGDVPLRIADGGLREGVVLQQFAT